MHQKGDGHYGVDGAQELEVFEVLLGQAVEERTSHTIQVRYMGAWKQIFFVFHSRINFIDPGGCSNQGFLGPACLPTGGGGLVL